MAAELKRRRLGEVPIGVLSFAGAREAIDGRVAARQGGSGVTPRVIDDPRSLAILTRTMKRPFPERAVCR